MKKKALCLFFIFCSGSFCRNEKKDNSLLSALGLLFMAYQNATTIVCTTEQLQKQQANRMYQTSFESVSEFSSFYIVPQNYQGAASHDLTTERVHSGTNAHKAWVYASGPNCSYPTNCNHRGYPTIQLNKLPSGGFKTPVYIEYYTYLDMNFPTGSDWFSFATFSADPSDQWRRVVLINTDATSRAYLMHVPIHGQSNLSYQNNSLAYPQRTWVKISACLDFDPNKGFAKVWQDNVLISTADVKGACGVLEQAHFGLYASPTASQGTIYNDDLLIQEVATCP